jgi:hypothetical protein
MFFHLFDGYTEVVHELLGVFFMTCAIFHIVLNWKALKVHFNRGVFMPALLSVWVISVVLIIGERMYPPVDILVINKLVKAPIHDAFKVLDVDYKEASEKLRRRGIQLDQAETMEDL